MKKVLILGASGMLGSMIFNYLDGNTNCKIKGTLQNFNIGKFKKNNKKFIIFDAEKNDIQQDVFNQFKADYIINCIGVIKPYCKDNDPQGIYRAIKLNALFPHILNEYTTRNNSRIIQIATDCVYDGTSGQSNETVLHNALDVYGKTKSLGEVHSNNFLNIRCSIIGPELNNKISLLEWFLGHQSGEQVNGFSHHYWNGVTTLQFAKLCDFIIGKGDIYFDSLLKKSFIYHFVPNNTVNKYELLNIFNKVFNKKYKINEVNNVGNPIDRTLSTIYSEFGDSLIPMEKAIAELKDYMDKVDYYN